MLIDTHCHIHEADYPLPAEDVISRAREAGVDKLVCVGTSEASSAQAVTFAEAHDNAWASIGVHPHEAKDGWTRVLELGAARSDKLIAVGEIGLDYFYSHSPRDAQIAALEAQLELALRLNVPVIFHVREAFEDFWPVFDNFHGLKGVLHSFTDSKSNLEAGLARGLYVGVNGISTFTKDRVQRDMFAAVPLERMVLETDAPFLTPSPIRGKVNEPAFVRLVAEYQAQQRGISLAQLAAATTSNATALFALS